MPLSRLPRCLLWVLFAASSLFAHDPTEEFVTDVTTEAKPWTHLEFQNDPDNFQFAVVSDRTGSPRKGVFQDAVKKLNWMMPEFVVSLGDLIKGTSENATTNDAEWDEFLSWVEPLKMPFFFAAGNHDIQMKWIKGRVQPDDMLAAWNERFGTTHYSFVYKNVLFVVLFTNDNKEQFIGEEQVAYFEETLAEHADVRWTFVLLHHPLWVYPHESNFSRIEDALKGRKHTVLAGHHHRYVHMDRNDSDYILLASTGGGSKLRGQAFGEFDHFAWFTMTDEGPVMANLELSGIMPKDVATDKSFTRLRELEQSAEAKTHLILETQPDGNVTGGSVFIEFSNRSLKPLQVEGRFKHNHVVYPQLDWGEIDLGIGSNWRVVIEAELKIMDEFKAEDAEVLELDLKFSHSGDEDIVINQTYPITLQPGHYELDPVEEFSFIDVADGRITASNDMRDIRYTLDGSEPTINSPMMDQPVPIEEDTVLKARVVTQGGIAGPVDTTLYKRVPAGPGLMARYYEHDRSLGKVNQMPIFSGLYPTVVKPVTHLDLSQIARRDEYFALIFYGWLEVPESGNYGFHVDSADGVRLMLNGKDVVDDQIKHPRRESTGFAHLEAGRHAFELHFFQSNHDSHLSLDYTLPSGKRLPVPASAFSIDADAKLRFKPDPEWSGSTS